MPRRSNPILPESVEDAIAKYRTRQGSPESREAAEQFAKTQTRELHFERPSQVREVLGYLSGLAAWCIENAVPLEPDKALRHTTIERFIRDGMPYANDATKRNARVRLRKVGRRLVPEHFPVRSGVISKSRPSEPYSSLEIDRFLGLAKAQRSPQRQSQMRLFVCLGVGAGLMPNDYRNIAGTSILKSNGMVVVRLAGAHERTVPIDEPYGSMVYKEAQLVGQDHLLGIHPPSRGVTQNLTQRFREVNHEEVPNARRLRATWIVRKLERINLRAFCEGAGIAESSNIFRLLEHVPLPTPEEILRVLHEIR